MRHARTNTPAYIVWVEARPSCNGKGKEAYYRAVKDAAAAVIGTPIDVHDVEIEITYVTATPAGQRIDTDNVQKPTLDALKGVAYNDDRQVRRAESAIFDRAANNSVHGLVEHIGRLFYSGKEHVVLIQIYSDSRLAEIGGAEAVQQTRIVEDERQQDEAYRRSALDASKLARDEFVPSAGVYRDPETGHHVCPRCRSDNKRSLLVEGNRGFSCPVCSGYFVDKKLTEKKNREAERASEHHPRGPHGWMAN